MSRIIDRFDEYMRFNGLTDDSIASLLELNITDISDARKQGQDLSVQTTFIITQHFQDINKEWLIQGSGEMLNTSPHDTPQMFSPIAYSGANVSNCYNETGAMQLCEHILDEMRLIRKEATKERERYLKHSSELVAYIKFLQQQINQLSKAQL